MATTSVARRPTAVRAAAPRRAKAPQERYLNRELSWMDLNERVLQLAEDPGMPLLERARFVSIFASNLDEFYQVRVAGLRRQEAAGLGATRSSDGLTSNEQLARIQRDEAGRWRAFSSGMGIVSRFHSAGRTWGWCLIPAGRPSPWTSIQMA